MSGNRISEYQLGDMLARFIGHEGMNGMQFELIPAQTAGDVRQHREFMSGVAVDGISKALNWKVPAQFTRDNLLQIKLIDEISRDGFGGGVSMFDSCSTEALQFTEQVVAEHSGGRDIQTVFMHPRGLRCISHLLYQDGLPAVEMFNEVKNESGEPLTLELLSSFVLSGITPYAETGAPERLKLHRFRSWWCAEGRHEICSLEELHLERTWLTHGMRSERFGQVGSMPVRKFFPFIGAEDTNAGVVWGAKLAWAGSWQMEAIRRGDTLTLTGGHADREFGHWTKTLAPGETLTSPAAMLSCLKGSFTDLCQRFLTLEETRVPPVESEEDMPVIFNEWCTSWGKPSYDNVIAVADRLKGLPVKYCVIDDGWAVRPAGTVMQANGDWVVNGETFPGGLKPVADALKERGFIPGIWFEFEVCNEGAKAWDETAHQLWRDGKVFQSGTRRYWDFRDPWVHDYLFEKVTKQLRDSGFRYLKVDYNDSIGMGCDDPDSLGEGLRQHLLGVQKFFRSLREEIPDLVIENCSSGGHRLEPSMMQLASIGSFSDAHEGEEIPIIGSSLQLLIPPRQSQIWAVLRRTDSVQRLVYSLAAGFLGRLCLSGEIHELSEDQIKVVQEALEFYQAAAPVIKTGRTEFFGDRPVSYIHPKGWQANMRYGADKKSALVVIHSFAQPPEKIELPLAAGNWRVEKEFSHVPATPEISAGKFSVKLNGEFSAQVYLLKI
ncbi:MAG: glycoside hydrolase family 36 protein [Kiritimatiellales bacterium]